ncbi:MAG: DoxX family protein [Flavobacteriaceae bacterium]|nr:DoxX family protein [Flavobacteriaceae bacterium]
MENLYKIGMNNAAQLLILAFLAITFLQSGIDKITDWKGNVAFLKDHFSQTIFKNKIPFLLGAILFFEIIVGILNVVGIFEIYVYENNFIGFLSAVLAAKILLALLLGQRIAKDYAGAMTIAVYFIVAIIGILILE